LPCSDAPADRLKLVVRVIRGKTVLGRHVETRRIAASAHALGATTAVGALDRDIPRGRTPIDPCVLDHFAVVQAYVPGGVLHRQHAVMAIVEGAKRFAILGACRGFPSGDRRKSSE
jgi:hypothetical protein